MASENVNCTKEEIRRDSLTQMSDEVKEMYCEQCEKDLGTRVRVDGFCTDCLEYLCTTCIRYHKKYVQHTMLASDSMPQDFCFDKCQKHPKEIIKLYCKTCKETACVTCRTEKHGNCEQFYHIPSWVQSDEIIDELAKQLNVSIEDMLEELVEMNEKVDIYRDKTEANKTTAELAIKRHTDQLENHFNNQHEQILKDLERHQKTILDGQDQRRAEIIARLDKEKAELLKRLQHEKSAKMMRLEQRRTKMSEDVQKAGDKLINKSLEVNRNEIETLQNIEQETKSTRVDVTGIKQAIDMKIKSEERCGKFVALTKAKSVLEKMESDIRKAKAGIEIKNYVFHKKFETMKIWSSEDEVQIGCFVDKSEVKRTLSSTTLINIRAAEDDEESFVTGLCQLGTYLVVVDQSNSAIKVIDTTRNCLKHMIRLLNKPFDVACVGKSKVATTQPEAGWVQIISIAEKVEVSSCHRINVGKSCMGIEYWKPNLIVAFKLLREVKILGISGEIIKSIYCYDYPIYIKLSPNTEMLYIQVLHRDRCAAGIQKMNLDGQHIRSTGWVNTLSGLAVDLNGSIYIMQMKMRRNLFWIVRKISPTNENCVHQWSGDLKSSHELLTYRPCPDSPSCLHFDNQGEKLYVGSKSDNIVVYTVS